MRLIMLLIAAAVTVSAQASDVAKVRVTGQNVGLRAQPGVDGMLLERAKRGTELAFIEKANGWVAVQVPENLEFWVSSAYVQDGIVQAKTLRVRSAPSLNSNVVAVVSRGDLVSLRGESDSWLEIASPFGNKAWISEKYVAMIESPKYEPESVVETMPEPAVETIPELEALSVASLPEESQDELQPLKLVLDDSKTQGVEDEIPGILRRANPGLYKLVLNEDGVEKPICLVRGNAVQMEPYLNRSMLMKGKKYWAKDVELPIIQPNKIYL